MEILGIATIVATLINILYSYFERVENFFWNWPAYGLIAIGMFMDKAYATAIMLMIQAIVSTHGFFIWTKFRDYSWKDKLISVVYDRHHHLYQHITIRPTTMNLKWHAYAILGTIILFAVTYWILGYTDDISPAIDASSFAIFTAASILLNFKKLENWLYFIAGDIYTVALTYKASNWYNLTSILLFIFLSVITYIRWRKMMTPFKQAGCS